MKVAVLGANGQLGQDVVTAHLAAGDEVIPLTHQDVSVESLSSLTQVLQPMRPDLVVNTAAFHNVERCEVEPEPAFLVNALGARNVALAAAAIEAKLIQISTDYVFDGAKSVPYVEEDMPRPLNVYANSKLAGEYFVRGANPRHFIMRVSAIYGVNPCRAKGGLNFVDTMLKLARERDRLRVVNDEFISPTWTAEIGRQSAVLGRTEDYGLYHATAEGSCSWYEFTQTIFELTGTKTPVEPAAPGEFSSKVTRPKYSVLENRALQRKSMNLFRHWKEGLIDYLAARRQSSGR
jgi:dTDP-4-dehydrorhamnose reductase